MHSGGRRRLGRKVALAAAVLGLTVASGARRADAIDWEGRWHVGARAADYFPADEVKGGFRINQEVFGSRNQKDVKPKESFFPVLTVGYGVKRWEGNSMWRNFQLSLEAELGRLDTTMGDETGFKDPDASTRLARELGCDPGDPAAQDCIPFPAGESDTSFEAFPLGDLTLTPMFVNAVFHWGSDRADFYAGAGLGVVLADLKESDEYRAFTGDYDGVDDVTVGDSVAVNLKLGSNLRLTKSGNTFLFFEFSFFTTSLFGGNKVEWTGTVNGEENGVFLGSADYDTDRDGIVDRFGVPADLRIVDPGKVRVDGATAGVGIRYRFGGKRTRAASNDETAGF